MNVFKLFRGSLFYYEIKIKTYAITNRPHLSYNAV